MARRSALLRATAHLEAAVAADDLCAALEAVVGECPAEVLERMRCKMLDALLAVPSAEELRRALLLVIDEEQRRADAARRAA
jgi:hypothetical protein